MTMNPKVLLVDDETDYTDILSERLESRGFNVEVANNGLEALSKIDNNIFDVIFLDLSMPGISGIETLQLMMAKNKDLQVYLLTGKATLQKGIEAVKIGAKDVIEKPADIDEIVTKINDAQIERLIIYQKNLGENIKDLLESKSW